MDQSNQCIHILRDIISRYEPPSDTNISVYTGLMEDLLVDYPREKYLLKLSLEQGLVFRLIKENQSVPFGVLIEQMAKTLFTNYAVDKPAARWSIETWASALDISVPSLSIPDISADFSCDKKLGASPVTICFTPAYVNEKAEYFWSFGDGDVSDEQSPCHQYSSPGTFSVSLRVSLDGSVQEKTEKNSIEVTSAITSGFNDAPISKDDTTRKDGTSHGLFTNPLGKNRHFAVDLKNKRVWIAILLFFGISIVVILGFQIPHSDQDQGGDIDKSFLAEKTQNQTNIIEQPDMISDPTDPEEIHENLKKFVPLITAWKKSAENADYEQLSYDTKVLKKEIAEQEKIFDIRDLKTNPQGDKKKLSAFYYSQYLQYLMGLVKLTDSFMQFGEEGVNFSEYEKKSLYNRLFPPTFRHVRETLKSMYNSCSEYPGKCGAEDPAITTIMNLR